MYLLEWFCEFIFLLMLVGVVVGLLWFCLINLCWEVSPSAQRVSIVTVGNVTSQKYPKIFFFNFIIYSRYKLSQLRYFPGIFK